MSTVSRTNTTPMVFCGAFGGLVGGTFLATGLAIYLAITGGDPGLSIGVTIGSMVSCPPIGALIPLIVHKVRNSLDERDNQSIDQDYHKL